MNHIFTYFLLEIINSKLINKEKKLQRDANEK